jgi:tRNA(Ile2) C34 agmatinyltransferase TiaS
MECPKCRSTLLMIRQNTGLERLRSFFTGLRLYRCRDCDEHFRAEDRRAVPREVTRNVTRNDVPHSVRHVA